MRAGIAVVAVMAACGGAGKTGTSTSTSTSTSTPTGTPTGTPVANVATETAPMPQGALTTGLLAWPVKPFTAAQKTEVKACDFEKLGAADAKLADDVLFKGPITAKGTCEQAAWVATCASHSDGQPLPDACASLYHDVLVANPAFALSDGVVGALWGRAAAVSAPPVASQKLASVVVDYSWGGLGQSVNWTLTITKLGGTPKVEVTGATLKKPAAWSAELGTAVDGLRTRLDTFLPIAAPLEAVDCTDNYPQWKATLTFADGKAIELDTHGSNLISMGGPWQMTLDGATYIQTGPGVIESMGKILEALGLPLGEPEGAFCRGFDFQAAVLP